MRLSSHAHATGVIRAIGRGLILGIWAIGTVASANVPSTIHSLTEERAAAAKSGLVLSLDVLSAPLPSPKDNAAPLYQKFQRSSRSPGMATNHQEDALLGKERGQPNALTDAEWSQVQRILTRRASQVVLIREAAHRSLCVFSSHEYVPQWSKRDAPGDLYLAADASMREAVRLIVSESIWEAHLHQSNEAIRDLSLGFRIGTQAATHDTLVSYLSANAMDSVTAAGFKSLLLMSGNDPSVCRAVQSAIVANWHRRRLSDSLKIELAIQQSNIDATIASILSASVGKSFPGGRAESRRLLDEYGVFELDEMRRCILFADASYARSAPALQGIAEECATRYPEQGELLNFVSDYSGAAFQRDWMTNYVNIVRCGAAVLAYHATHGKYPTALIDAIPGAPADAFDGRPFRYEVTSKGFALSANHQRKGYALEPVTFSYSQ